jgi:hypothetical protein
MSFSIISSMSLFSVGHHTIVSSILLPANIYINYCHLASIFNGCLCHGGLLYTFVHLLAMEDKILLRKAKHL